MRKSLTIAVFAITILPCKIIAQATFHDAYNEFKQKAHADYEEFRQKVNKEYADWMRKAWEWHDKIAPMPRPKDEMMPPIIYNNEKRQPKPLPYEEVEPTPEPSPQPKPIGPIREKEGEYKVVSFRFYGTEGQVRVPQDFVFKLKGKNEGAYAKAWEELSSGLFDNLIRDCLIIRMEHQLCDWAFLTMLGSMSETVCGQKTNEARMLQGYVLCQSGFKIRFGFTKNGDLRLLFNSEHIIYDLGGFNLEDGLFYLLEQIDDNGINVCDISYPEEKPLSLMIHQEQLLSENLSEERKFVQSDGEVVIRVQTNLNWMDFCSSYPTSMIGDDVVSRWAMYANTPLSERVKKRLYPQLSDAIKKHDITDEANVANWLLYWIQTAFVYEYDNKVWGHDRAFFAEETLFYPYCDCEDRSILYSRLVRDLLGLDVLLVFYPGHLATAVAFNEALEGDYIMLNGKRFTVCDPTYIGAPIGITMPGMDNKTAKIILLK